MNKLFFINQYLLYSGLAIIGLALLVAWHKLAVIARKKSPLGASLVGWGGGLLLFFLGFITLFSVEWGSSNIILSPSGRVIGHIPPGYKLVSEQVLLAEVRAFDTHKPAETDCLNSVSMLVNDPVVRKLSYRLTVRVQGTEDGHSRAVMSFGWKDGLGKLNVQLSGYVRSLTYELNQHHSDELKGFYNPEAERQKADFLLAMHRVLDAPLAEHGLELAAASFTID